MMKVYHIVCDTIDRRTCRVLGVDNRFHQQKYIGPTKVAVKLFSKKAALAQCPTDGRVVRVYAKELCRMPMDLSDRVH